MILSRPDTAELLHLTLGAAFLATLLTLLLGVPLALCMQGLRRGAEAARLLVLLPLAMPPVVSGLALSAMIGNNGLFSPLLDTLGWQIAFRFAGVVASHVFVALPFVVVTVDAALRQVDGEVTASAASIGMNPTRVLRRITLPTIAPAIATGAGLAFARSLGEFGTTITFAGSMPGVTRTMSLAIYLEREVDRDAAYALSAVLILLAVIVLVVAALPQLLRREPEPRPRDIGPMDHRRLRELTAPVGGVDIDIDGTAFPAGSLTAIVGPNGSGKSTLMGVIAGRLTGRAVRVGGRSVDKLPAHRRGVVLLTQNPGLPRVSTVGAAVTMATRDDARTRELLTAAGLASLIDVPVPALSGGQAAQVALVRALAARPRALILDEPLASVDASSTAHWRQLLRATAPDRTTLLVTHDPLDVASLSDHLVVLEAGQVVAAGSTKDLLRVPPTDFVAQLSGLNRLAGIVTAVCGDAVTVSANLLSITGTVSPDETVALGDAVVVTLAPDAIDLGLPGTTRAGTDATNVWTATVDAVHSVDVTSARVSLTAGNARLHVPVTPAWVMDLGVEPGVEVECVCPAQAVKVYPSSAKALG